MPADVLSEDLEVVEALIQDLVQDRSVESQVAVHQGAAQAGDSAEGLRKISGEDAQLAENVDGPGVVGGVASGACGEVEYQVERVLAAELYPRSTTHSCSRLPSSTAMGFP